MNKSITGLFKKISLSFFLIFFVFLLYINLPFISFQKGSCIYIDKNEKFNQLVHDLSKRSRYISPFLMKVYAKFSRVDRHLEAGEYCFMGYTSVIDVMEKIARAGRTLRKFTLVEGWTYQETLQHLMAAPSLSHKEILNDPKNIADVLKLSEASLEGQFYPDTYYYAYPDTALDILTQAHFLMDQKIKSVYQNSQAATFYKSPYELLIAASIIQKEAKDPIDQMFVASVLVNRMKQHMRLQMDPTVIYGLRENPHVSLTKKDLKIDSPYNTYLYLGLPPTPICMPGETALFAAAHPKDSRYLYYVSKKNGVHQFSETLEKHNEAIREYLLKPNVKDRTHAETS